MKQNEITKTNYLNSRVDCGYASLLALIRNLLRQN
jgi:hypothetical protein